MAVVTGDEGNNDLIDTAEFDTIESLGGDDTITVTTTSVVEPLGLVFDSADGGTGTDTLVLAWGDATEAILNSSGLSYTDGGVRGVSIVLTSESVSTIERFVITSGSGNDNFLTLDGNDIVNLGAGNDNLLTQGGDDQVEGGEGDDLIDVGTGADVADGGGGTDGISADLSTAIAAIFWNLQANTYGGPAGTSFSNFEYFGGSFGGISTGSGNDTIVTRTADLDDVVSLGAGDDTVTVADGADTVDGGDGDDTLVVNYGAATAGVVNGSGVSYTDGASRTVSVVLAPGDVSTIERFVITTGSGNDNITIFAGDDVVTTGAGNDHVESGDGNDTLDGGAGIDEMHGEAGNDVYYADSRLDVIVELADEGQDKVFATSNFALPDNVENLQVIGQISWANGNDLSNFIRGGTKGAKLYGYKGGDTIWGSNEADTIGGGGDGDWLNGYGGDDTIAGDSGNDTIDGGAGLDTILGGPGIDIMTGGADADLFVFGNGDFAGKSKGSVDRIRDFDAAEGDRIDLSGIDAIAGGSDNAFTFIGTAAFSGSAGQLRYAQVSGNTFLYMDINGDSIADYTVRLDGLIALTGTEFVL